MTVHMLDGTRGIFNSHSRWDHVSKRKRSQTKFSLSGKVTNVREQCSQAGASENKLETGYNIHSLPPSTSISVPMQKNRTAFQHKPAATGVSLVISSRTPHSLRRKCRCDGLLRGLPVPQHRFYCFCVPEFHKSLFRKESKWTNSAVIRACFPLKER